MDVEAQGEIVNARDKPQVPTVPSHTKWKDETLEKLFSGHPAEIDAEATLMQALAELEEDERLDGEIEIAFEDEYHG